jgi:hypothetical protein
MRRNVAELCPSSLPDVASEAVDLKCASYWTSVIQADAYFSCGYSEFIFCALQVLVESFMVFLVVSSGM